MAITSVKNRPVLTSSDEFTWPGDFTRHRDPDRRLLDRIGHEVGIVNVAATTNGWPSGCCAASRWKDGSSLTSPAC